MKIDRKIIEEAKQIRHEASLKWGCPIFGDEGINWLACVGMALKGEKMSKKTEKLSIELEYNAYKGSGKAWLAKVTLSKGGRVKDRDWMNPIAVEKDGYRGVKEYEIEDGTYESCQSGTKKYDSREIFTVKNGAVV